MMKMKMKMYPDKHRLDQTALLHTSQIPQAKVS